MRHSERPMNNRTRGPLALLPLIVSAMLLLVACGGGEAGLSRAEVEEIVRAEMAEAPVAAQPEPAMTAADVETAIGNAMSDAPKPVPGLSPVEVEEIVKRAIDDTAEQQAWLTPAQVEAAISSAIEDMPQPDSGLTRADAERIARGVVAAIPPRSAPAQYTRFFVDNAICRYETQGLDATLAHYNREASVDGQWYVFIIDGDGVVIGHPDPHRVGLDLTGWVGTDANGYNFGPEMLSATEEGRWVSYVYSNPESALRNPDHAGLLEYKHVWVVRHDGLLFASGWHAPADEYTQFVVEEAIVRYTTVGLDATLAYYGDPESVDAQWYVFIATPHGEILGHYNADDFAEHLQEMFDDGSFKATGEGMWVNHEDVNPATGEVEDKHFWLVEYDGLVFGSGWHHDESGG